MYHSIPCMHHQTRHVLTFPTVRRCVALFAVQVPVGPEGLSGQSHLPLPVASYNPAFRAMFNEMTAVLDFILWHTTLVAFDTFLHMSLILYEFGFSFWSKRETWRKFKKTASLSGVVDAVVTITLPTLRVHAVPLMTPFLSNVGNRCISSPCRRIRVFLCLFVPWPLTVCMAVVKR